MYNSVPLETETHLPVQSTNHQFFGFQVGGCTKLLQQIPRTLSSPSKPFSATSWHFSYWRCNAWSIYKKMIGSKTGLHQSTTSMTSQDRSLFPKWPHPPFFSSMVYHADTRSFSGMRFGSTSISKKHVFRLSKHCMGPKWPPLTLWI